MLFHVEHPQLSDWLRRQGRYREHIVLVEDLPEIQAAIDTIQAPRQDSPERHYQRVEALRLIQVALDRLPARYGNVLEWKYIEGHSVKEIAARLHLGTEATQSLLARARRGDMKAHEILYRAYGTPVYTLAVRMLQNPAHADDVLQETSIEVIRKIDTVRDPRAFPGWVKRIAVNKCLGHLRSAWHRLAAHSGGAEDEGLEYRHGDEGRDSAAMGSDMDAERALALLPATARAVVWLSRNWLSMATRMPRWAPMAMAARMVETAVAGPTVTTITSPLPSFSTRRTASSTAYSSYGLIMNLQAVSL